MTRKRDVIRPYPPDLCSAETLAYRLDMSRATVDTYIRLGHLPPPIDIGTQRRWRWTEIETWISMRNHEAGLTHDADVELDHDPFLVGVQNVRLRAPT